METVSIKYVVDGTVNDEDFSGDRISVQLWKSGKAFIRIYTGEESTNIHYTNVKRIIRSGRVGERAPR